MPDCSPARVSRYLHNDPASLAARLDKAEGNTLVVTDGVFSMDGNLADRRPWPPSRRPAAPG